MKWYEEHTERFEEEYRQLSTHGLKVTIADRGYGNMFAISERIPGQIDLAIYFPENYPTEAPRYYLTGAQNIPSHPDGAVDLKQLGISWNAEKRAWQTLDEIRRVNRATGSDNDLRIHDLTLKNLTRYCMGNDSLGFAGRETELRVIKESMLRHENAGCVLLGRPGVGKSSLALRFIQEAANGNVPPMLKSMTFYELRLEDILAVSQHVGDAERAIRQLLARPGILGLFVDEIHRLVSPMLTSVADAIKPEMASGKIRIIGASTYDEWRRVEDKALKRRLAIIEVPEPDPEETLRMIKEKVTNLRHHYGIDFSDEAIRKAIALGKVYINEPAFPAKACDILDRAAAAQTVDRYDKVSACAASKEEDRC